MKCYANPNWRDLPLRPSTRYFLEHLSNLEFDHPIKYVLLFGSEAKGIANALSDVDISVVSDKPLTRKDRVLVNEQIDAAAGNTDYQLVYTTVDKLTTSNTLDVNFSINAEGVLLYERA